MAVVSTGARLHFGFQNLSLAHERLYGGLGVGLAEPRARIEATRADDLRCADPDVERYATRVLDVLDLPGADVSVEDRLPRHVGLGSGTQLALATLVAIAEAYGREVDVRALAPQLGRGGRSGVGVATFEAGGFVADAGHPTTRFTTAPPADGEWEVPAVAARHALPEDWRFVLTVPDVPAGRSGSREEESMRSVVERADAGVADDIAGIVTRRLLPAVAEGRLDDFGAAVAEIGRLNGAWYADEQGGVFRPPVGTIVGELAASDAFAGAGQSSWGPTVYGLTDSSRVDEAREAAAQALSVADVEGRVLVCRPGNAGAWVDAGRRVDTGLR
ncbi:beta-ribofuranosylaminobenzene 5'-phosphate synthase family protein [Haloarchaeobius amylolyticus]|uniref:beta-ribofuranosylaminobenzene 5'-phosphate synthase family protein n=1 Tax=Haloarchaeobius amylolyticus TaxID=1198296 RepID=UPI00226FFADB|nr:beta-ribofuranosylaminobenzene 5'-phosphate synthase family protein [Haloarchaeobius amylolyticus]